MIFLQYLKPSNLSPAVRTKDILTIQREIILQRVYNILFGLFTFIFPLVLIFFPETIRSGRSYIYVLTYLGLVAATFIRSIDYRIRASILVLCLDGLGALALLNYGLSGTGALFLFGAAILSVVLFNPVLGRIHNYISMAILILAGYLMVSGKIPLPPVEVMANSDETSQWVIAVLVFLFLFSLAFGSINSLFEGLKSSLFSEQNLAKQLGQEQASLERRVEERSVDLRRRISQFEIASEIAKEISGETNLEPLLSTAANLIRDRFGFYHVGIFIVDGRGEFAVLRAATGEAGRTMLERSHRLKIGEVGIVGYVASRGEPRITSDVTIDMVHFNNPLLPNTRSEMALPLRGSNRTIGALDVQSVVANAFSQEDIRILQIIADQLAIAFEKTALVEELRRSVDELDANYRATTLKSWHDHLKNTRRKVAYRYRDSSTEIISDESEYAEEALDKGSRVLKVIPQVDQEKNATILAVPIKLRNQVLGVVDIRFDSGTVSPDLIALIESTVDRLAVSLENARLLEEIQLRAERERLVSELSSKVRAAPDVDSVLKIAIQEIGKSLGASEVMVQLRKGT